MGLQVGGWVGHCPPRSGTMCSPGRFAGGWDIVPSPFKAFIAFISLRLTLPGLQGTGRGHEGTPLLPGGGILLEWWLVWCCTCVSLLVPW